MYPNIRLHCLVLALTLLPLAGVTTPSLAVFKSAVTFGRTDKINLRKTRAESIGAATVQKVSQQSSGTKQPSAADVAWNEGMELYRQGTVESLKAAIEKFEEAAKLYSTSGYRGNEAFALNKIGLVYSDLGDKKKALTYYNQALPLLRVVGDRSSEADTLNNIGSVYDALGDKRKALDYYNQALPLKKIVGDLSSEAVTLNNIGAAYYALGEKQKALSYFNQVLLLLRAVGDRKREAVALNNIGRIYDALGEKRKALSYFSQSLPLSRVVGSRSSEAITLNNIGGVYYDLGEKQKALSYFNQSLPLRRAVGDRDGEATTLNNIGEVYHALGEKQKALIYYNQALPLSRAIGDRDGEATTLNNIGGVYHALGEKQKALIYYNQALSLLRAVGNRDVEAITLSNISYLLTAQKQPTLAIFFYKQSVNITESLRNEIRGLPKDIQQTYAQTVAKTYRNLADLLLQQNRILEAQQVLELLKVQEINSIDKDIRATLTPKGIEYTPAEAQIKSQHENLVALGEKLLNCETKSKCSDAQKQQWQSQRETLKDEFENTVAKAEQNAKDRITQIAQIGKDDFIKSYQALVEAQPGTLLVYPFVTENKLWLLWASAGGVLGSTKVPTVGREKLLKAVQEFRDRLQKPTSNPAELAQLQQSGQQLYEWLIKPLEPALASKSIKHWIAPPAIFQWVR
jgi:tetratricopeptide (TPR) repeat protein